MAGSDAADAPRPDPRDSFAARLKRKYGDGIDPKLSLGDSPAEALPAEALGSPGSCATDGILQRLAEHGLKHSRYRLMGEVARGGMGAILKVWDEDLRRALAMKVILGKAEPLPGMAAPREGRIPHIDGRHLARFLEEAQVTGQLDHPGIVPVHELGLDSDGRVYFTMKLVKGRDLKQIFDLSREEKQGWSETRVLGVILKACEAMAYAHAKGVIHRDLKPANVMVGNYGEVYVMDWGLARVLGRKDPHDIRIRTETAFSMTSIRTERREEREDAPDSPIVTMDGDVMGTPAYMPPEQARGEVEKLNPRSDVYSIGAMLYHLLTGQMPFVPPGARMTNYTVLARLLDGPPKPVHEIRKDVPAELEAICEKAMEREAERRYPDTLALADDLRAYLEHRVVAAYETGALAEAKKWVQRNQSLAGAIAAALLIAIGGLALISTVQSRAKKEIEARNKDLTAANVALLSLSAIQDLSDLIKRADGLWPARPENVSKYEAWLRDARTLIEGRPADESKGIKAKLGLADHRRKLDEIEARALPESGVETLEGEVSQRRTWRFADDQDLWWHAQLSKLVADLGAFSDSKTGLLSTGINPEHGWGMERRLEFARTIGERSVSGTEATKRWAEAITSVQDRAQCPKYDGLVIAPQLGLLPIGRDPASGLWEFAHIETGEPAERGADGKLLVKQETGLVFVLIPGGTFAMGAQGTDPSGKNYDPKSNPQESPIHMMTLAPYFLSKYEMTQGQWLHVVNSNPSERAFDLVRPVETVSWKDCTVTLERLDLVLPTEAQWEYAARAGTASVWWTGDEKESLAGACNLADAFAKSQGGPPGWFYEEGLDDGYTTCAPVGNFRANAFGLHDVIGNVWEWCRDGDGGYDLPVQPGDGERQVLGPINRMIRGASFMDPAEVGRSAFRNSEKPEARLSLLGLRPACEIATR